MGKTISIPFWCRYGFLQYLLQKLLNRLIWHICVYNMNFLLHSSTYNIPHQYLPLEVEHRTGSSPQEEEEGFSSEQGRVCAQENTGSKDGCQHNRSLSFGQLTLAIKGRSPSTTSFPKANTRIPTESLRAALPRLHQQTQQALYPTLHHTSYPPSKHQNSI